MAQYQVQDQSRQRLMELLERLKINRHEPPPIQIGGSRDRFSLGSALAGLLGPWSTNNQASQGIYGDVGDNPFSGWGTNNAAAGGGIYGGGQSQPTPQAMPEPMPYQEPQISPQTIAILRAASGGPRGRPSPQGYDTAGMDALTAVLSGQGITEGPNVNIQDDSRERAMAWLRQQQGG